jgi:quercetin dioxygenase-like cupin family protein
MERMPQAEPIAVAREGRTRVVAETPELRVTEYVLGKGEALPWHFHSEVTDHFYCLQGMIRVALREGGQEWLLRPGESCTVPPQVVHRSSNAEEGTSRYLLVQGIGRHDFIKVD